MFNVGDKSKAICDACKKMVETTMINRDVPLSSISMCDNYSDKDKVLKDILVSICNNCGNVLSIPSQSSEDIKQQLRLKSKKA